MFGGIEMVKKKITESCCTTEGADMGKIESLVTIDERGQMVLPKEIRDKANIKAGDKLAVISWKKGDKVCCISLIKADNLSGMVKDFLGPMLEEIGRDGFVNDKK